MKTMNRFHFLLRRWAPLLAGLLWGALVCTGPAIAQENTAAALRARHAALADKLAQNNFQRALYIDSNEADSRLTGDVYAVLNYPFATVSDGLRDPASWCEVLILPFNTKYCHAVDTGGGNSLLVRIGRKHDQPVKDAYKLVFSYANVAAGADYFESRMASASGPLGTRDYRIVLAATPLDNGRTFMHLRYSYGFGIAGKIAMQGYLATVGADKVGFSITGRNASGQPVYIDGMRGVVERNAMRYYLAIDAYLDSLSAPMAARVDRRIQHWFAATERYPRQLREMDRPTYMAMKRSEYERQQVLLN